MTAGIPGEFSLSQNYPNPFNPSTQILFSVPEEAVVSLKLYNVLGQEVSTLIDDVKPAGVHVATWNGTNDRGERVGSGTYLYRLEAKATRSGSNTLYVKKMILTK
jgi:flagellar hook assembly protein FlgD